MYPHNLEKMHKIQVKQGLVLVMEFTLFDIAFNTICQRSNCTCDHLTIIDGDGTTLMGRSCGYYGNINIEGERISSSMPPTIISKSNVVNFFFRANYQTTRSGWSVSWSAMTPGM